MNNLFPNIHQIHFISASFPASSLALALVSRIFLCSLGVADSLHPKNRFGLLILAVILRAEGHVRSCFCRSTLNHWWRPDIFGGNRCDSRDFTLVVLISHSQLSARHSHASLTIHLGLVRVGYVSLTKQLFQALRIEIFPSQCASLRFLPLSASRILEPSVQSCPTQAMQDISTCPGWSLPDYMKVFCDSVYHLGVDVTHPLPD
jgi:hypothetical protein